MDSILSVGTRVASKRTGNYGTIESFGYIWPEERGYNVVWDGESRAWWIDADLVRTITPLEELAEQAD